MDYNPLISQKQGELQSLSEKLAEIEARQQAFTKGELDYLGQQKRPEGMSVVDFYQPRMTAGRLSAIATENALNKKSAAWKELESLFGLQQEDEQFGQEMSFKEKQLAQEKAISDAELAAKYNPSSVVFKGADKTAMNFNRQIYNTANQLQQSFTGNQSGIFDYLKGSVASKFNLPGGAEMADYKTLVSQVNTAIRNKISGTAVTDAEAKQLKGFLIQSNDSDTEVQRKINGLIEYSKNNTQVVLDNNSYDIDAGEYLSLSGSNQEEEMVRMTDPQGQPYDVPASEVEEARKNGWR